MCNRNSPPRAGLLIVVLLSFFSSLVFATADGPDYLDVQSIAQNDELTIHHKPNDTSAIAGKIPHNATCLKNLGCSGDSNWWCKIEYQGTTGWVDGRFLGESGDCSSSLDINTPQRAQVSSPEVFSKQLLEGKVLYIQDQEMDTYVKLSFQESNLKLFDGTIAFTFLDTTTCHPDTVETLQYRLKDGKIIYYANDGSKSRLTLQTITPTSWKVRAEEDMDGDGQQFGYGQAVNKIYEFNSRCK